MWEPGTSLGAHGWPGLSPGFHSDAPRGVVTPLPGLYPGHVPHLMPILWVSVKYALRTAWPGPDPGWVSSALVSPFVSFSLGFLVCETGAAHLPGFLSCQVASMEPRRSTLVRNCQDPWLVPGQGMSKTPGHSTRPREGRQLVQSHTASAAGPRTRSGH